MIRLGINTRIATITATTSALKASNPALPNDVKTDAATGLASVPPDASATAVVTQSKRLNKQYAASAPAKIARPSCGLMRARRRLLSTAPV